MKFTAAAALLFAVPSVNAFAPSTAAFRTSTQLFATEAATEEKVGYAGLILHARSCRNDFFTMNTVNVFTTMCDTNFAFALQCISQSYDIKIHSV